MVKQAQTDLTKKSFHIQVITCILGTHERELSQVARYDTPIRNTHRIREPYEIQCVLWTPYSVLDSNVTGEVRGSELPNVAVQISVERGQND